MKSRARHRVAPGAPRPSRGVVVALCVSVLWTAIGLGGQGGSAPAAVMFEPAVGSDMGESGPQDIERADFDRDGWPDVAILTTGNGRQIQFLDITASGALAKGPTLNVPFGSGFASGSFDSDGLLDLAVTQIAMNSSAKCDILKGLRDG